MKLLEDIGFWTQVRPRVLHRLPGRLRLRIPLLKRIPDDWLNVAEILERVIAAPQGIVSARSDRRTGSLLIVYDADVLQESDILGFLHALLEMLRRNRDRLRGMPNGRAARVARQLEKWVRAQTRQRPVFDPKVTIPDAIWS